MMKKRTSIWRLARTVGATTLLLGALGISQQAGALPAGGVPTTGITVTKHNLGSTGTGTNHTSSTDEICVFCHTPHAADTTAPVPLWNKRLLTGATYTTYANLGSATMDANFANDGTVAVTGLGANSIGSISLACLSCHDGTQAMDNIINAPGSGGYNSTGGGTAGLGWTWVGNVTNGKMTNSATTLAMLSPDLSNDHPIGIQYCGGGPIASAPNAACKDPAFVPPTSATIGNNLVFWVDTAADHGTGGTAGTREKTDMILYNRTFANVTGSGPSVECGSCHDPHSSVNNTFLRVSNTGSGVCLSCHVK